MSSSWLMRNLSCCWALVLSVTSAKEQITFGWFCPSLLTIRVFTDNHRRCPLSVIVPITALLTGSPVLSVEAIG